MKKTLIICATRMSSSIVASKTTDFFKQKRGKILVDVISTTEDDNMIKNSDFDLFLISPQMTIFSDKPRRLGESVGKPVVNIPLQAYVPIPTNIQELAEVVEENI